MKTKRYGWLLTLVVLLVALCTVFVACKKTDPTVEDPVGTREIVFVDAGGIELVTITDDDLANTVKRYDNIGGIANVYAWNCVVTSEAGKQEITVILDGKPIADSIRGLMRQNVTKIEIYPAAYFTLLTYGTSEYKAVYGQVPTAIPAVDKAFHTFDGYYATIEGVEVQLTNEGGAFLKKWEYTMPSLTLVPHFTTQEIAVQVAYDGGDYTAEDEAAGRGYLANQISAPNKIKIGDALAFLRAPSREGFTFDGWYSGSLKVTDGHMSYEYNTSFLTELFDIAETADGYVLTLTANWKRNDVRLVFKRMVNVGSNESQILSSRDGKYGTVIPFSQSGIGNDYCSVVWKDANGAVYQDGATLPASDLTLYAYTEVHKKLVTDEEDHTSLVVIEDCEDVECSVCKKQITHKIPHEYDLEYRPCRDRECTRCHYIEKNDAPHTYTSEAKCIDRTCTVCGEIENASEPHKFDESSISSWICQTCGKNLLEEYGYYRETNSTKVYFGNYPSDRIDDTDPESEALLAALNALVDTEAFYEDDPTAKGWIALDADSENVWYQDVKLNDDKYRVLYVDFYREGSKQEENGVEPWKLYWFKYGNMTWTIVNESGCGVTMIADKVLECGNADYATAWLCDFLSYFGETNKDYFAENALALPEAAGMAAYTDYAMYLGLNLDGDVAGYLTTADASTMDYSTGIRPVIRINLFPEASASATLIKGVGIDQVFYRMEAGNEKELTVTYSFDLTKTRRIMYRATPSYGYTCDTKQQIQRITTPNNTIEVKGTPVTVTITFDAAGGEGGPTSLETLFDAVLNEIEIPTKARSHFRGYYLVDTQRGVEIQVVDEFGHFVPNAGSDNVSDSGRIVPGTYMKDGQLKMAADFTLVARWGEAVYSIAYDSNGGEGEMSATRCPYNTPVALTGNTFTKTGYHFGGWATSADAAQATYSDRDVVRGLTEVDGAVITLYAMWLPNSYTVQYAKGADDATGTTAASTHTYDAEKALTANGFTRTGYAFVGWSDTLNNKTYTDGESVVNLTAQGSATVTLTATWTPAVYTVTYLANGGEGATASSAHTYGTAKVLTANEFTRTGYDFYGWARFADAFEGEFADKAEVLNLATVQGAEVKLYAVWVLHFNYRKETPDQGDPYYVVTGLEIETVPAAIRIPASYEGIPVKEIGNNAFKDFASMTSITIPATVTRIGESAFQSCTALTEINYAANGALTTIAAYAFNGCTALTAVTVPASVTTLGTNPFRACTALTSITVAEGNAKFVSTGNCLIDSSNGNLVAGCKTSVIPTDGSVTTIGSNAFAGQSGLTAVTIPASVTGIAAYAFQGCSGLTEITIPFGITTIKADTFAGCTALTTVEIPASVTDFEKEAFYGCTSLATIRYFGSEEQWTAITKGDDWDTGAGEYTVLFGSSGLTYSLNGSAYTVTGIGTCTDTAIRIPSSYNGKPVTVIGANAFWNKTNLTSVVIPNSVTSIERSAFTGCTGLTSITIPQSVTVIREYAFDMCSNLVTLTFAAESRLTSLEYCAFGHCSGLTSIVIPASVNSINRSVFSHCSGLTSLSVVAGNTTYRSEGDCIIAKANNQLVLGCKSSVIPSTVTSIGEYAFSGCSGLITIALPSGITSIGNGAFWNCSGLTGIEIPSSVTGISSQTFEGCTALTSITIPDGVKSIGSDAFSSCSALKTVSIGKGVTSISTLRPFSSCSALESITVAAGNTVYRSVNNCVIKISSKTLVVGCKTSVIPTDGTVTIIGEYAFSWCKSLTSIMIPNGVTRIAGYAFAGCSGLTTVSIPASVTEIGDAGFNSCKALATIIYDGTQEQWNAITKGNSWSSGAGEFTVLCASSGLAYSLSGNEYTVTGVGTCTDTAIRIPSYYEGKPVIAVAANAFKNKTNLTSVNIANSVTSIGSYAFQSCTGLTSVTFASGSTLTSIAACAFQGCSALTTITIPASVASIGNGAFRSCSGLTSITVDSANTVFHSTGNCLILTANRELIAGCKNSVIPTDGSVTSIQASAFYGCTGMTTITIPSAVASIADYAFYNCSGLTSVTIPASVKTLGNYAFQNCAALTSIEIPSSANSIGAGAFSGCSGLTSVTIPFVGGAAGKTANDTYQYPFGYIFGTTSYTGGTSVSQTYYGNSTSSTTSTTYYIPSTLRSVTVTGGNILYGAFRSCSMLTSITLPTSLTTIGNEAFRNCTGLPTVTIPSTVTTIGNYAFSGCTGMTSITIPSTVTTIGNSAFYGCTGLTSITIPSSVATIGGSAFYGCTKLATVSFASGSALTTIGEYAFRNCSALTSITIPSMVTTIGNYAFYGCTGLTSITIPSTVTSIGNNAFYGCTGLTSIAIPSTVTSIGSNSFSNCTGLTSVTIPSSLTIGSNAFSGCTAIESISYAGTLAQWLNLSGLSGLMAGSASKSLYLNGAKLEGALTIPSGRTNVPGYAFRGVVGITSVTIPTSVTSIASSAFFDCSGLTSVTFETGSALTSIGTSAFRNCSSLTSVTIPSKVTTISSYAFSGCTGLTSLTFASGSVLKTISEYAFQSCTGLTSVTIPTSVTTINNHAFSMCTGLTSMSIPFVGGSSGKTASSTNQYPFGYIFGTTSYTGGTAVSQTYYGSSTSSTDTTTYYVPSSLRSVTVTGGNILRGAFQACYMLTSITLPSTTTEISEAAFSGCIGLTSITLPFVGGTAGKSAYDTYQYPFGYIFGTESYLGSTAVNQTYYAGSTSSTTTTTYYVPSDLRTVTVTGGEILRGAFINCTMLTSVTLASGVTSVAKEAFRYCTGLTSVTIAPTLTTIGASAFANCNAIATVNYTGTMTQWLEMEGLKELMEYGTANRSLYVNGSLVTGSLTIPSGLTEIAAGAFYKCKGLTSVTIANNSGEYILVDDYAFSGTGLTSVTFTNNNVEFITFGTCAFSGCTGLTAVTLPDVEIYAGEGAFYGCGSLTSFPMASVVGIGKSAFSCCGFVSIELSSSLTEIPKEAFCGCSDLTSITIPASVTVIEGDSFDGCSGLTSLTFASGSNLVIIGSNSFGRCSALTSVTFPSSVTRIERSAFYCCTGLTSVTIPSSVTTIDSNAFYGCTNVATIYYYGNATTWGAVTKGTDWAYNLGANVAGGYKMVYYSNGLSYSLNGNEYTVTGIGTCTDTALSIPAVYEGKPVTAVAANAFKNKTTLTSVTIPASVRVINEKAFGSCTKLTSVTFASGSTLTTIGNYAFDTCRALTSISIPASVTSIGYNPVSICPALTSITVGAGNTKYRASGNCLVEIGTKRLVSGCSASVIPTDGSVTTIGRYAFEESTITTVTIPTSVTVIDLSAFSNCRKLADFYYDGTAAAWTNVSKSDGWNGNMGADVSGGTRYHYHEGDLAYTSNGSGLTVTGYGEFAGTDLEIPATYNGTPVTEIAANALANRTTLTSVIIPSSVTTIGAGAFSGCSGLTSMTIPFVGGSAGKTSSDTYQYPFGYIFGTSSYAGGTSKGQEYYGSSASSLTTTTYIIPSSLRTVTVTGGNILRGAFYNCSMLTSVTLPSTVTTIYGNAFYGCTGLTSVTIPSSVTTINGNAFYNCTGLTSVTFASGSKLTTLGGSSVFYGCANLTSITIPSSVTSIGGEVFRNCTKLASVSFGTNLKTISDYAFYGCTALTSIAIPASVTSIGANPMRDCSALTTITVASGNTTFTSAGNCLIRTSSKELIAGCKSSVIPTDGSVTSIGRFAFSNSTGLTSITIPSTVTSIGNYAFYGCTGLTSITIPSSVTSIGTQSFYGCSGLTSATFASGSTLTTIGESAFRNCSHLTSITIPSSVTTINNLAFSGCSALTSISIPFVGGSAGKTSSSTYQYPFGYIFGTSSYTGGTAVSQTYYGSSTSSTTTTTYYIPSSLRRVTVTGGEILRGAFINCTMLTSVTLPASATGVGDAAFKDCTGLSSVTLPTSATRIGGSAFYGCTALASVTIPSTVTTIASYAFCECKSLEVVTFAATPALTKIEEYAFASCTRVSAIYYEGTSSQWSAVTKGSSWASSLGTASASGSYTVYYASSSLAYSLNGNTYTVTGKGSFTGSALVIPSTYNGKPVTAIASSAFAGNTTLTSVYIPSSVTSIGSGAFSGCSALTTMTIPFVGGSAGKTASSTYQYPFGYIFGTSSYTGGTSKTQQYYGSSTSSTISTSYYIPSTLRTVTVTGGEILYGAFYNCSMLTTIIVTANVTSIERNAFYNCSGLTTVVIPASVTSVGTSAFSGCSALASVRYSGNLAAWCSVSGLQYLMQYGSSSKSLYLAGNRLQGTLTIPSGVTTISAFGFYRVIAITSLTIPSGVTTVGERAFRECTGLTSVTLSSTVTTIGRSAFSGCTGLTSLSIPASVTLIDQYAFDGCAGLTSISVASGNTVYKSAGNCLIERSSKTLIRGCKNSVIPTDGSVTKIGNSAFYNCTTLTSITIPSTVTTIGTDAFCDCSGLTSITIPNSVTSIGTQSFYGCTKLATVTFASGSALTTIGESAFRNCSALTSITIPSSVTSIGNSAFYGCSGLTSVTIPSSVTTINSNAFSGCTALATITYTGTMAQWCASSALTGLMTNGATNKSLYVDGSLVMGALSIPSGVTSIAPHAFYGITGINSVSLPSTLTTINNHAFDGCTGLTSITIPSTVTTIGSYAFRNCTALTSITIPSAVTTINGYAFYGCTALTSIMIPSGVTRIYDYTFYGCTALTSVTIPASVTQIGGNAFYNCKNVATIYYGGSSAQWSAISKGGSWSYNLGANVTGGYVIVYSSTTGLAYSLNGNAYTVTGMGTYTGTELRIPSTYNGKPVTAIAANAFQNNTTLISITIPTSVTSIGSYAFYGCVNVTTLIYEGSGTMWIQIPQGTDSFANFGTANGWAGTCTADSFTYAMSGSTTCNVTGVGSYTGSTLVIPSVYNGVTVTGIAANAFLNNTNIRSVYIPSSVTRIYSSAFEGCTSLTTVTIESGLTTINDYAFRNCTALGEITLPNSLTSIGEKVFSGCSHLVSMTIPFVGNRSGVTSSSTYQHTLGYLFGTTSYTGGTSTVQNFYASSTTSDTSATYYIPSSLRSVTVTGGYIPYDAFDKCSMLTSITIGSGVTQIGKDAFWKCSGLVSVSLPETLTSLGDRAFNACTSLQSITIPSKITKIGYFTFSGCTALTTVTLPSGLTTIEHEAFDSCSALTSINIPSTVTSIGYEAFEGCTVLPTFTIPSGVTRIREYAFAGCNNMLDITIPSSVTTIESNAFANGCGKLATIYYTGTLSQWCAVSGLQHLMNAAASSKVLYVGGTRITGALSLPSGLTSTYSYAFCNCKDVTSVTLPSGMTSIGSYTFKGCSNITSVTIPSSVTTINTDAFYGCSALATITYTGTMTQWLSISGLNNLMLYGTSNKSLYVNGSLVTGSLTIPSSVTTIANSAFRNYTRITSVTIPSSVTTINDSAFGGCSALATITYTGTMAQWCGISGTENLMGYGTTNKSLYVNGSLVSGSLSIPSGVTTIGSCAFYTYTRITSVTIPSTVTTIGSYAFYDCTGLTSVTIPSSVTTINGDAFEGCSSLATITYSGTMAQWCAISGLENLMKYGTTSKSLYVNGSLVTGSLSISSGVTTISGYAFYKYTRITSVSLPSSLTTIGNYAFYGCTGLTSLTIPSKVTSIGDYAFRNCTGLTSVTFASGSALTTIGSYAFAGCTGLTSITIPTNVTKICTYAFSSCSNLTAITFANTTGWFRTTSSTATSGTSMTVTDTATNATNLTSTYNNYYWKRS